MDFWEVNIYIYKKKETKQQSKQTFMYSPYAPLIKVSSNIAQQPQVWFYLELSASVLVSEKHVVL